MMRGRWSSLRLAASGNGWKAALIAASLLSAGLLASTSFKRDEGKTMAFFYDASEGRLFAAPGDSVPPLPGVGGEADDAFRATVIAPRGLEGDPGSRIVAFLETFTPELRAAVVARRSGAGAAGQPDALDSRSYVAKNTLVRLPDASSSWVSTSSPEGQAIMTSWQERPAPDGRGWVVCRP